MVRCVVVQAQARVRGLRRVLGQRREQRPRRRGRAPARPAEPVLGAGHHRHSGQPQPLRVRAHGQRRHFRRLARRAARQLRRGAGAVSVRRRGGYLQQEHRRGLVLQKAAARRRHGAAPHQIHRARPALRERERPRHGRRLLPARAVPGRVRRALPRGGHAVRLRHDRREQGPAAVHRPPERQPAGDEHEGLHPALLGQEGLRRERAGISRLVEAARRGRGQHRRRAPAPDQPLQPRRPVGEHAAAEDRRAQGDEQQPRRDAGQRVRRRDGGERHRGAAGGRQQVQPRHASRELPRVRARGRARDRAHPRVLHRDAAVSRGGAGRAGLRILHVLQRRTALTDRRHGRRRHGAAARAGVRRVGPRAEGEPVCDRVAKRAGTAAVSAGSL